MKKSILILVGSVVLFSLFNTTETNFRLWNNPTINTDYIDSPDIPVSFETDISLFGLFINFFSDLELDFPMNNTIISNIEIPKTISNLQEEDDVVDKQNTFEEDVYVEAPIVEEVIKEDVYLEEVIEALIVEEVIEEEVEDPIVEEVIEEEVEALKEEAKRQAELQAVRKAKEEAKKQAELQAVRKAEEGLKEDIKILRNNPQIKDNAKELLLESLESGIITMDDVVGLLSENSGKKIKEKHVKKLIKSKKK